MYSLTMVMQVIYSVHFAQGQPASSEGVSNLLTCYYLVKYNVMAQTGSGREEASTSVSNNYVPTIFFQYILCKCSFQNHLEE